jgi:eukaryotic-like serine/threonine-protein kinase
MDGSDPFEGTKYRSICVLGKGGMGTAHVAEHRHLGTQFVCKILRGKHRDNPALADRMRVEAQSLARLSHPNIVRVFDFDFTPDGRPFIVMEYLQGQTLAQEMRVRGELPCAEAIEWTRQLLSALSAAHALGIVHRDVKLDNLFLHQFDSSQRILKVLDFGIAKIQDGVAVAGLQPPQVPTHAGAIVGTPRFLSPEASMGRAVDHRADVYSAGVVLYMFLCGRGPWDDAASHASVFSAQVTRSPEAPSVYAKQSIPAHLDAAVLTAMSIEPEERFQSAKAFEAALSSIATHLHETSPRATEFLPANRGGSAPPEFPEHHATLGLTEGGDTRTELPAVSARMGAIAVWPGSRLLAFTLSAAVSAALTWLTLSRIFPR